MESPSATIPILANLLHLAWFGRLQKLARSPIYRLWWRGWRDCETILAGHLRGDRFPAPVIAARLGIAHLPLQRWLLERLRPGETVYLSQDPLGLLSLLAARRVGTQGRVYGVVSRPRDLPRLAELRAANQLENLHFLPVEVARQAAAPASPGAPSCWAPPQVSLDSLALVLPPPDLIYLALGETHLRGSSPPTPAPPADSMREEGILAGAERLLSTRPPHTWIVESSSKEEAARVAPRLAVAGYQVSSPPWPAPLLAFRPLPRP